MDGTQGQGRAQHPVTQRQAAKQVGRAQNKEGFLHRDASIHGRNRGWRKLRRALKLLGKIRGIDERLKRAPSEDRGLSVLDPLVHAVWVFVLVFLGLSGLETIGSYTSLEIHSNTLGRVAISLLSGFVGVVFVGAGHGAGSLLHAASEAKTKVGKLLRTAAAVALLAMTTVAIIESGKGRDDNTEAGARVLEASGLRAQARSIERQIVALEDVDTTPPSRAEQELRERQRRLEQRADRLLEEGFDLAQLSFLVEIQLAALLFATLMGWQWSATERLRLLRVRMRQLGRFEALLKGAEIRYGQPGLIGYRAIASIIAGASKGSEGSEMGALDKMVREAFAEYAQPAPAPSISVPLPGEPEMKPGAKKAPENKSDTETAEHAAGSDSRDESRVHADENGAKTSEGAISSPQEAAEHIDNNTGATKDIAPLKS